MLSYVRTRRGDTVNKGRYINKLHLVRQHRKNWYLKILYEFMDKVSAGEEPDPTIVKKRADKNKEVNR